MATEEEYDAVIHIVTALYLNVTAYNIKWLRSKIQAEVITLNASAQHKDMAEEDLSRI